MHQYYMLFTHHLLKLLLCNKTVVLTLGTISPPSRNNGIHPSFFKLKNLRMLHSPIPFVSLERRPLESNPLSTILCFRQNFYSERQINETQKQESNYGSYQHEQPLTDTHESNLPHQYGRNFTRPAHVTSFIDPTKHPKGNHSFKSSTALPSEIMRESVVSNSLIETCNPIRNTITAILNTMFTSKRAQGRVMLLMVSLLYGTLNVTLRTIYASKGAPDASVLSFVRQLLSILTFLPILAISHFNSTTNIEDKHCQKAHVERDIAENNAKVEACRPMWLAALELAFWNFGAQALINTGLLVSSASRASFLTQTSVVITPLLSSLAGERIKSSVWIGCGLALFGLFLISSSSTPGSDVQVNLSDIDDAVTLSKVTTLTSASFIKGDILILLGALSWSTYIFRTSKIAKSYSEVDLQFTKAILLALMYGGWFAATLTLTLVSSLQSLGLRKAISSLWEGWQSPFVWFLLTYSAFGPGVVADLLQQKAQKETSASESNIILCLESAFAVACAFLLLGEKSSIKELFGGALILAAAFLASL